MKNLYRVTFDEVYASDTLRREVWSMTKQEQNTPKRRRVPEAVRVAAVLVLALTRTALASASVPEELRDWLISHGSTKPVGISDMDNGVTVTVDAVTAGNSALWLMLKVDYPANQNRAQHYQFYNTAITITSNSAQDDTFEECGSDYAYVGVTDNGTLTLLLRYSFHLQEDEYLLKGCQVKLRLTDLMCGDFTAQSGEWELSFALEPAEQTVLTLDSAVVPACNEKTDEETTVELQDIRISAVDIIFTGSAEEQMCDLLRMALLLEDGTEISQSMVFFGWMKEAEPDRWVSDYLLALSVDLPQVTGIRFGDTLIPLK